MVNYSAVETTITVTVLEATGQAHLSVTPITSPVLEDEPFNITGSVTDAQSGAALLGARVEVYVTSAPSGYPYTLPTMLGYAVTNSSGAFVVPVVLVTPGSYTLLVRFTGGSWQ